MKLNATRNSLGRANKEAIENKDSILGSNSFNQRLGTELNSIHKSVTQRATGARLDAPANSVPKNPGPLTGQGRIGGENPSQVRPSPPPTATPLSGVSRFGALNSFRKGPTSAPAPLPKQARAGGKLNSLNTGPGALAGRDAIARRRVGTRFDLLPDQKPLWDRIGWSAAGQLAFLGLLLLSPTIFPQQMQTALNFDAMKVMQPVTHIHIAPTTPPPTPRPAPPKIKPEVRPKESKPIVPKPKPVVIEAPELNPRQPHIFLVLKPEVPKARKVETKPVELKPVFQQTEIVMTSKQPVRPKEEAKPKAGSGPAVPATLAAPLNKVQTGGFGDPNGVSGRANPSKAANINQAGSPNLPGGPGYGNGSGGAQGMHGTVASEGSKKSAGSAGSATTGVDILYMPNPAYSVEGRTRKMEGDVVLEVVFLASGQVQVVRVVSGLGYGLDEAAIQAAKQIRFKPAKRDGQPVDFAARVRIEFRLTQ